MKKGVFSILFLALVAVYGCKSSGGSSSDSITGTDGTATHDHAATTDSTTTTDSATHDHTATTDSSSGGGGCMGGMGGM